AGTLRLGTNFLNGHSLPDHGAWKDNGVPYNTANFYFSVTPFEWIEFGITFTLLKMQSNVNGVLKKGYNGKDRNFNLKLRPLKEGKYYPAVAVGLYDFIPSSQNNDSPVKGKSYWKSWFIGVTKHFDFGSHRIGANLTYRRYASERNHRWNGLIGGVTYAPPVKGLEALAEWSGCSLNFGAQYTLWKQLRFQACLVDCRYPNAGVCWIPDLF
ncbi:MAG: YjbH domain-containing protein, partial [Duncaniella sp.]|nr:YjbH domain-containing protein [Duncaniella sp.]